MQFIGAISKNVFIYTGTISKNVSIYVGTISKNVSMYIGTISKNVSMYIGTITKNELKLFYTAFMDVGRLGDASLSLETNKEFFFNLISESFL